MSLMSCTEMSRPYYQNSVNSVLIYMGQILSSTFATKLDELTLVTKSLGLLLGDRACLALGISLHQPVLTSDRQWSHLNLNIEARLVRS